MPFASLQDIFEQAVRHHQAGRLREAEPLYQYVLQTDPNHAEALHMLGWLAHQCGHSAAGADLLRRAMSIRPAEPRHPLSLAMVLHSLGRMDEAIRVGRQAIAIAPDHADAHYNLGVILASFGDFQAAADSFGRAITLRPNHAEGLTNLANALNEIGRVDDAIAAYRQAIGLRPDLALARWNLALALLLKGNFAEGWKHYEARWAMKGRRNNDGFSQPLWDGSDLKGRRILLRCEQGFGDSLHFIRYAPRVAAMGGTVFVQCQKELKRLFETVAGLQQVFSMDEVPSAFDVQFPLMSLAGLFGTDSDSIPRKVPYVRADPGLCDSWRSRIAAVEPGLRIGLAWSGLPNPPGRSVPPGALEPLGAVRGVRFISLQKPTAPNAVPAPDLNLIDWTSELEDFAQTAALMANLDLIITIDTSVAHLAGAMGLPTWLLVKYAPDWRWGLNRRDCPWYPAMRLYHQPTPGDWVPVIQEVVHDLTKMEFAKTNSV